MSRPPLALVAVVALLTLGTAAVAGVGRPAPRAVHQQVEVLGAVAVCPDVSQTPGTYQTRISVGAAPLPEGRSAQGGSVVTNLVRGTGEGLTQVPIKEPGQVAVGLGTRTDEDGVVVSATGALATGLEVEQVTRVTDGRNRGLANLRCEAPKREAWFVGASTGLVDASMLVLANVDDTPATVDITSFGRAGAFDARPGAGMSIAPHTRLLVPMDSLAPDGQFLVVRVASRQGRVVAAMRNGRFANATPLGFDYVPQAQPPAQRVVVPGLPLGIGFRGLVVGNPSYDDTTVSVQVTLRDGQFVPAGMDEIRVPARRAVLVDVSKISAVSSLTATVTSSGSPVVAGGYLIDYQRVQPTGIREIAYAGSSLPLSGSSLLTDLVIDRPTESTLILSAPEGSATVTVTPITVLGSTRATPAPKRLAIPAGRTVTLRLTTFFPPGTQAQLAVEVRPDPGSGPVYATRYLRERGSRGTLSTLLTLQGPAQLVDQPVVTRDAEAGYP